MSIFYDGQELGEISKTKAGFEAKHINGLKANFVTFEAAKRLFESITENKVIKPSNKQLNLF